MLRLRQGLRSFFACLESFFAWLLKDWGTSASGYDGFVRGNRLVAIEVEQPRLGAGCIYHGGLNLPPAPSLLLVGTPGAGKTKLGLCVLRSALMAPGGALAARALVFIPKVADILPQLSDWGIRDIEHTVILSLPTDRRAKSWDFSADVAAFPEHLKEPLAQDLATVFAAAEKGDKPFFRDARNHLIAAAILHLDLVAPSRWRLIHLVSAFSDPKSLRRLLSETEQGRSLIATYLEEPPETAANIFASLANPICKLRPVARLLERATESFRLTEWATSTDFKILLLGRDPSLSIATSF
jgi:hypothetical protein